MIKRLICILMLLFSVLFLPFYVSVSLVFVGMLYFSFFWEGVVVLFISDLLYATKQARFEDGLYVSLLIAIGMLLILELLKNKLKFYPKK